MLKSNLVKHLKKYVVGSGVSLSNPAVTKALFVCASAGFYSAYMQKEIAALENVSKATYLPNKQAAFEMVFSKVSSSSCLHCTRGWAEVGRAYVENEWNYILSRTYGHTMLSAFWQNCLRPMWPMPCYTMLSLFWSN